MDRVEIAKTVDDAKQALIQDLNLGEFESYDFEILQEPTKGFLGIGGKDAEVRLLIKTDKEKKAVHIITEMAKHLGYEIELTIERTDEGNLKVIPTGENIEKLFSQLGRTIYKWEFLINCMINQKDRNDYMKISFEHEGIKRGSDSRRERGPRKSSSKRGGPRSRDGEARKDRPPRDRKPREKNAEEDQERKGRKRGPRRDRDRDGGGKRPGNRQNKDGAPSPRQQFLANTAKNMANKVIETKQSVRLNPMNSYDRRIIHTELQEMNHIATRSEGEGDDRCVVIDYVS